MSVKYYLILTSVHFFICCLDPDEGFECYVLVDVTNLPVLAEFLLLNTGTTACVFSFT